MKFLHHFASLALCLFCLASCESLPPICGTEVAGSTSPSGSAGGCQTLTCSEQMLDCNSSPEDGCEVNAGNDVSNCGSCGYKCPVPSVGEATCVSGVCGSTICGSRYKDCNSSTADSCETDSFRDPMNCGGCGIVCQSGTNAIGACVQGKCQLSCQGLFLDCNGDVSDGCEVNGASDLANCGTCGNACPKVGAITPACSAGSCGSTACTGTFRTCKAGPVDGCETDTASSVANCGTCGKVCGAVANGTPGCAASNCSIGSCNAGFDNCDGNVANGCEANLNTNIAHCSGCNKACPTYANASAKCTTGMCSMGSCNSGFADCDMNPATGCEINTNTDVKNCGGCNMPCGAGKSCFAGKCSSCGDGVLQTGEERDPPPGPFTSAPVDANSCRFHFEAVAQLYCNGSCTWAGASSCDQADADIFCKLRTGNPASVAMSFTIGTALAVPGFSCPGYGVNLGPMTATRGVSVNVWYQDSSILGNHGAGLVILNPVCS